MLLHLSPFKLLHCEPVAAAAQDVYVLASVDARWIGNDGRMPAMQGERATRLRV